MEDFLVSHVCLSKTGARFNFGVSQKCEEAQGRSTFLWSQRAQRTSGCGSKIPGT